MMDEAKEIVNRMINKVLEQALQIEMKFTRRDGSKFRIYAKTVEDIKQFTQFLQEYTAGVIKKTREDMEKDGWRKDQDLVTA